MSLSSLHKNGSRDSAYDWDRALVNVGKHHSKEDFIDLFEYFAPRIKSFLIAGGLSPDQADELAQETMLTIWHKAAGFNPDKAKAGTWIFTVARNKKIDFFRKNRRQADVDIDALSLAGSTIPPDDYVHDKHVQDSIENALNKLPDMQKDLIHRSFFEGHSHSKIAKDTGIALGTVKSRIRAAINTLRGKESIQTLKDKPGSA